MGANPEPIPPAFEPSRYCGWAPLWKSWFCRFYDHLFPLVLLNLAWFISLLASGLLFWRLGWFGDLSRLSIPGLYAGYLFLCLVSLGWARVVFKVFNEGQWAWQDFLEAYRRFGIKAMALSTITGAVFLLVVLNVFFYSHHGTSHRFLHLFLMGIIFWVGLFGLSTVLYQWPILFFQDPALAKIFYRSALLSLSNGPLSLGLLIFFLAALILFSVTMVPWFFFGLVFFFSFQCVALEKNLLRYKITYGEKPLETFLEDLDRERERGWRDFLRPWENR